MHEFLFETILPSMASGGAISLALIWLTKTWMAEHIKNGIKHEYDREIERVKSELRVKAESEIEIFKFTLKVENEREIEILKANLIYQNKKREIEFSRYDAKRAEIISDLYGRLFDLNTHLDYFFSSEPLPGVEGREQLANECSASYSQFYVFLGKNRIYLSEGIASHLDELDKKLRLIIALLLGNELGKAHGMAFDFDLWKETTLEFRKYIPGLLKELEGNFRRIVSSVEGGHLEAAPSERSSQQDVGGL